MIFSVVMGLSGFVVVFEKAAFLFAFPALLWQGLLGLNSLIFSGVLIAYVLKAGWFPEEVHAEARHPVKMNFLSTVPISFLLVSIVFFNEINPFLAFGLWWIGMAGQLLALLFIFPRWLVHPFRIEHLNPAWFIPIVGTILVPIVGVDAAPMLVSVFFFTVGMFFWIVFLSIVIYRLVFHEPPAERFLPTLFILVAPPSVGLISYFRITGTLDLAAYALYGLSVVFLLILLMMTGQFFRVRRFYLSWWAYVFPLDAFTIASMLIYEVSREPTFAVLSLLGLALTTGVMGVVGYQTLRQIHKRTLFDEN